MNPADEPAPATHTKVTVNLTAKSYRSLSVAAQLGEHNRTDAINRAVQLYAWWLQQDAAGAEHILRLPNGDYKIVELL